MKAPDNIYINPADGREITTQIYNASSRPILADEVEYIRHDINAAVEAERDELRKEMGRRVDDAGRLIYALSLEGRNLRQTIDQLRARLDAAMEWVPVAEADLQDGETIVFGVGEVYWTGRYDRSNPPVGFSHALRIKPPKAPEAV